MTILTWIIVGLIAGVLASLVMGGTGYGLIGDIIIGIVGAFVGGWIFSLTRRLVSVGRAAGHDLHCVHWRGCVCCSCSGSYAEPDGQCNRQSVSRTEGTDSTETRD